MQWYVVTATMVIFLISIFAIQNSQQITLKFLIWDLPAFPLVLLILFSTATGVLLTILFNITKQLKMTLHIHELKSRIKLLEKKLAEENNSEEPVQKPTSESSNEKLNDKHN